MPVISNERVVLRESSHVLAQSLHLKSTEIESRRPTSLHWSEGTAGAPWQYAHLASKDVMAFYEIEAAWSCNECTVSEYY